MIINVLDIEIIEARGGPQARMPVEHKKDQQAVVVLGAANAPFLEQRIGRNKGIKFGFVRFDALLKIVQTCHKVMFVLHFVQYQHGVEVSAGVLEAGEADGGV